MISLYEKRLLLLILIIFSCTFTFAQNGENKFNEDGSKINFESLRGYNECRLSEGNCNVVIELLRISQNNDSVAIEIFKKEYEISNMIYRERDLLLKKKYNEVIQYFALEGNKKYYCRLKKLKRYDPVLLIR